MVNEGSIFEKYLYNCSTHKNNTPQLYFTVVKVELCWNFFSMPVNFRMALIFTDFQQDVVGPIYLHFLNSVNIRAILSKV